jgi:dTDP-4-amino-4,6-dideoxygalactose transaminase
VRSTYLPYFQPLIESDDVDAVVASMRNGWLTTGPVVHELESAFANACGARHAIALNSCTAALQLGLIALGVGVGDEVVMPSLTFVAGANCVRQLGATPVFCDVDPDTLCVTRETIEAALSDRTKAVMPMHFGGRPVGIEAIVSLAREHNIAVIEDAAHALGTLDGGSWPGTKSALAAYSFYATKNITSAEGGMLVTNRDDIAEKVRILALHGMNRDAWKRYQQGGSWRYDVVALGYKCNMPDLLAALGLSQLRKAEKLQHQREELARRYLDGIQSIPGVEPISTFVALPDRHSWCIFAIRVGKDAAKMHRDALIDYLRAHNIGTSVHFIPTHLFSLYQDAPRVHLPVTESIWEELISLPLYPGMAMSDVDDVLEALGAAMCDSLSSSLKMS